MSRDQFDDFLRDQAARILEHCDAVQIMASFNEDGETHALYRGNGNWYARQGMAHEFINQDVAQENAKQIAERVNPPDEGDNWKEEA